jgi:hypothetical protein
MGFFCAAGLIAMGQAGPAFAGPVFPGVPREPYRFHFLMATLLVGYPFLEVLLSTARRGIKKFLFGRSMEWSEKEHIHHRLLKLGFKPSLICCFGGSFNLLMAAAGLLAMAKQNALAVMCLLPVIVVLAVLMPRMGFFDFLHPRSITEKRPYYQMAHLFMEMQRVKLDLPADRNDILALISQSCAELGVQGFSLKIAGENGNGGGFSFHWERPHDIQREYLNHIKSEITECRFEIYRDKVVLEDGRGEAFWIFEPHTVEDDLDVEYRVLVNDFMKTALERVASAESVPNEESFIRIDGLAHAKVRSSLLRRRFARKTATPAVPSLN